MTKKKPAAVREIVIIGDAHDSPRLRKDRFGAIGRYLAANPPDMFGSIGDFCTLDSLGKHHAVGSKDDMKRSTFEDDLHSARVALSCLMEPISHLNIPRFITLGNHEARAHRIANLLPKECGHYGKAVEDVFRAHSFNVIQYGDVYKIEGVGFTHVPFNTLGRPYSGKTMENQIARDSTCSMVVGHTHKVRYYSEPKIGFNNKITVINVGTAMPDGHVEDYAGLSVTGWDYGIFRLTVSAGQILGHQHISMKYLETKYKK